MTSSTGSWPEIPPSYSDAHHKIRSQNHAHLSAPPMSSTSQNISVNSRLTISLICLIGGVTLIMLCWCICARNRRIIQVEEDELHEIRRGRGGSRIQERQRESDMEKKRPGLHDVWAEKPVSNSAVLLPLPLSAEQWSSSRLTISTIIALPSQTPLSKQDPGVGFPDVSIGVLELGVVPELEEVEKKRTFFSK